MTALAYIFSVLSILGLPILKLSIQLLIYYTKDLTGLGVTACFAAIATWACCAICAVLFILNLPPQP